MFDSFAVHVSLVEKDDMKSDKVAVKRIDQNTVELMYQDTQIKKQNSRDEGSQSLFEAKFGLGAKSDSNMSISKASGVIAKKFRFQKVLGPKTESFKLNQAIRQEPEFDKLVTLICVGRYYPVMLDLKEVTCVKGQLAYIIHDMQLLADGQPLHLQVSAFTFSKGQLIDLIGPNKVQVLLGFELNYLELTNKTVTNLTGMVLGTLSRKLEEENLNPPSIFFYVTFQIGDSSHAYRYLLCDVYNPYKTTKDSPEGGDFCPEIKTLMKYIGFERSEQDVMVQEDTDSLDIFFNELVQHKSQHLGLIVCIPTDTKHQAEAFKLLDLASQMDQIMKVFNSYTFKLVHSAINRAPAVLSRMSDGIPESRTSTVRKSGFMHGTMDAEKESGLVSQQNFEGRLSTSKSNHFQTRMQPEGQTTRQFEDLHPTNLSEKIQDCVFRFEERIKQKDILLEMQTGLLAESISIHRIKQTASNEFVAHLEKSLVEQEYKVEYLKNLVKFIAEYKLLKDENKKAKFMEAIYQLGDTFGDTVVGRLKSLLIE